MFSMFWKERRTRAQSYSSSILYLLARIFLTDVNLVKPVVHKSVEHAVYNGFTLAYHWHFVVSRVSG